MTYRLVRTPGQLANVDVLHPNGGVVATIYDAEERLGQVAVDTILAALNGESHHLLEQARASLTRKSALAVEQRDRLARLDAIERGWREFHCIVADVQQWFNGFAAAHAKSESWERPRVPDPAQLRDLNLALQGVDPNPPEGKELPF